MDFDEGSLTTAYVNGVVTTLPASAVFPGTNGATLTLGTNAYSAPGDGAFAMPGQPSVSSSASAYYAKVATVQSPSARVRFMMRIGAYELVDGGSSSYVQIAQVGLINAAATGVAIAAIKLDTKTRRAIVSLSNSVTSYQESPFAPPADGQWTQIELRAYSVGPIVYADVLVSDSPAASVQAELTTTPAIGQLNMLGIIPEDVAAPLSLDIDNVVFASL